MTYSASIIIQNIKIILVVVRFARVYSCVAAKTKKKTIKKRNRRGVTCPSKVTFSSIKSSNVLDSACIAHRLWTFWPRPPLWRLCSETLCALPRGGQADIPGPGFWWTLVRLHRRHALRCFQWFRRVFYRTCQDEIITFICIGQF